jgi:hypothetical protein
VRAAWADLTISGWAARQGIKPAVGIVRKTTEKNPAYEMVGAKEVRLLALLSA